MISNTDLQIEIEVDSCINKLDLEGEILRTPKIFQKYLKYHYDYKVNIARGESLLNAMIIRRIKYYKGQGTADEYRDEPFNENISNQKVLESYLDGDAKLCDYREKIVDLESTRDTIHQMIENLKYRNNSIQTILSIRQFESGA